MSSDDRFNPYTPPKNRASGDADTEVLAQGIVEGPKPKWATVASYGSDARAVEALRLLENAHITCRVLNDGPVDPPTPYGPRFMHLGGHRVQVAPEDLVAAAKVLGVVVEAEQVERINPPDERMKKALMLAAFGTFLCPGVAHLVSMGLILATPDIALTDAGRKLRRWAVLIDLAMFAVVGFVIFTDT
jgi:hypothetical protein